MATLLTDAQPDTRGRLARLLHSAENVPVEELAEAIRRSADRMSSLVARWSNAAPRSITARRHLVEQIIALQELADLLDAGTITPEEAGRRWCAIEADRQRPIRLVR